MELPWSHQACLFPGECPHWHSDPFLSFACPQSAISSRKASLVSQVQVRCLPHVETPFVVTACLPCGTGKQRYIVCSLSLPSVPSKFRESLPGLGPSQGHPVGLPTRARHSKHSINIGWVNEQLVDTHPSPGGELWGPGAGQYRFLSWRSSCTGPFLRPCQHSRPGQTAILLRGQAFPSSVSLSIQQR